MRFHYTITVTAREGIYIVRLYSVPPILSGVPTVQIGDLNTSTIVTQAARGPRMAEHWKYLRGYNIGRPVELPPSTLLSFGDHDIESEDEFAQGIPRIAEMPLELAAIPQLADLFKTIRATPSMDIWCEISLWPRVEDYTVPPVMPPTYTLTPESLVWPLNVRNYFWGVLDRRTFKGNVNDQPVATPGVKVPNEYIQSNIDHDGKISMSFLHWLTALGGYENVGVKGILDNYLISRGGTQVVQGDGTIIVTPPNVAVSIADFILFILQNICPSENVWAAYNSVSGMDSAILRAREFPMSLPFEFTNDNFTTSTNSLADISIKLNGPLFVFAESGSSLPSFYGFKSAGDLLVALCKEFYLIPQIEIPTWLPAADVWPRMDSVSRVLFVNQLDTPPLSLYIDPFEDTIEYDPCAVYLYSSSVSQPSATDIVTPDNAVAYSSFLSGGTQSYSLLFSLIEQSYQNGTLTDDVRGWEMIVEGVPGDTPARAIKYNNIVFYSWAALHAYVDIQMWGSIRAMVTLKSRGVGLEPYGASAVAGGFMAKGPKLIYGLNDFGDFPLYRTIDLEVGLMDKVTCVCISCKRTPNGDTELKLLELLSSSPAGVAGRAHIPSGVTGKPPPPSKEGGGPPDTTTVTITGP